MSVNNFYEYKPKNKEVSSLVFMLHGVGSNGQDLISLAPYLERFCPNTAFISADAPFPCDMVPPGYPNSFQWFSLQDRDPHIMLEGVKTAMPLVEECIEAQAQRYDIPMSKVALLGFSQGTMTSLHVAPRLKDKGAGVLGYSGALLWDADQDAEKLQTMPIHLIHGQADDVVPVQAWDMAKQTLEGAGYPFSGHTTPGLPHSIDQEGIESGGAFLAKILS